MPDGAIYDGFFSHNKITGEGRMIYPNKDYYEGTWKDSKKEGKGKVIFGSKVPEQWYDGAFLNDKFHG